MRRLVIAPSTLRAARDDSLVRNGLLGISTAAINGGLGFLAWFVMARRFESADVGIATALTSASSLIGLIGTAGLSLGIVTMLARARTDRAWTDTIVAALVASAAIGATLAGAAAFVLPRVNVTFDVLDGAAVAAGFVIGSAAATVGLVLDGAFLAARRVDFVLLRAATVGTAKVAGLVVIGGGVATIAGIWWVTLIVPTLALVVWGVPRLGRGRLHVTRHTPRLARRELHESFGSSLRHQLAIIGGQLPLLALPAVTVARLTPAAGAYLAAAWLLATAALAISPAVAQSLFAEGSHPNAGERAVLGRRAARLTTYIGVPAALGLIVVGPSVLRVFGPGYAAAGSALLVLLAISVAPDAITNLAAARWRIEGHLTRVAVMNMSTGLATVLGAWLLLPTYGIVAAGWVWLVAQTIAAAASWVVDHRSRAEVAP